MMGLVPLLKIYKRHQRASAPSPVLHLQALRKGHGRAQEEGRHLQLKERALTREQPLILDFQFLEPWEVNSCCVNHPVYVILLWQPELRHWYSAWHTLGS